MATDNSTPDLAGLGADLGAGTDLGAGAPDTTGSNTKTFSVDEVPELSGGQVGDTYNMSIVNVSEDGSSYDVEITPAEGGAPAPTPDLSNQFVG